MTQTHRRVILETHKFKVINIIVSNKFSFFPLNRSRVDFSNGISNSFCSASCLKGLPAWENITIFRNILILVDCSFVHYSFLNRKCDTVWWKPFVIGTLICKLRNSWYFCKSHGTPHCEFSWGSYDSFLVAYIILALI